MVRSVHIGAALAALAFLSISPNVAMADSLEVSPTTLMLNAQRAGVLNVVNRGDVTIAAQVEAFDWHQDGGMDRLDPSKMLQISPPMVRLAPGEKQIVRMRLAPAGGGATGTEQAFRLIVSELPNPSSKVVDGVRMLLQFKIPVFVGGTEDTPRLLKWSAKPSGGDLVLHVVNDGTKHVKLARLHLIAASGREIAIAPESFYYVLPGAMHEWTISEADIASGAKLRIEGVDESNGTKIDDMVVTSP